MYFSPDDAAKPTRKLGLLLSNHMLHCQLADDRRNIAMRHSW